MAVDPNLDPFELLPPTEKPIEYILGFTGEDLDAKKRQIFSRTSEKTGRLRRIVIPQNQVGVHILVRDIRVAGMSLFTSTSPVPGIIFAEDVLHPPDYGIVGVREGDEVEIEVESMAKHSIRFGAMMILSLPG